MNYWKALAILFTVFSFGTVRETIRILTSNDQDIVSSRSSLIPISLIITFGCLVATVFFWGKARKKKIF